MYISWGQDEHDWYVDKLHWLVHEGRDDLIDELADDYERRRLLRVARASESPGADPPATVEEEPGKRRLRLVS